jgi:hypothetical protein
MTQRDADLTARAPSIRLAGVVPLLGRSIMRFSLPSPALVVACLALLVAAGGVSYAATGSSVNIVDPVTATSKAKVTSGGKLWVGDGAGYVTVDGTVSGRPAAPASPWSAREDFVGFSSKYIAGPSLSPINVTSLSISTDEASGSGLSLYLYAAHVPNTATSCSGATGDGVIWKILDAGDGVVPVSFSFPTPLQWKPPASTKACLQAVVNGGINTTTVNATGFYGG